MQVVYRVERLIVRSGTVHSAGESLVYPTYARSVPKSAAREPATS